MDFLNRTIKPSTNGVIVEWTYDVPKILQAMKDKSKKSHSNYGNIFEPVSVDYKWSTNYAYIRLKSDADEGGLPWITADKVYVPYNEELMIECINKSITHILENAERVDKYDTRDWVSMIGWRAFQFYCDSEYYKTKFMEVSEEWSAKCKELYKEPELLARCETAEITLQSKTERIDNTLNEIDRILASLPKSTTQKLRSDIENLKYTLRR